MTESTRTICDVCYYAHDSAAQAGPTGEEAGHKPEQISDEDTPSDELLYSIVSYPTHGFLSAVREGSIMVTSESHLATAGSPKLSSHISRERHDI